MRTRLLTVTMAVSLGLVLDAGCRNQDTTDPEAGNNLLGGMNDQGSEDDLGDDEFASHPDDEMETMDLEGEDAEGGVADAKGSKKKLPKRATPVKKCRGKGKKRKCKMVDPKPKVTAAYGVETLMGGFSWGMSPSQVLKALSKSIEDEYTKRQAKATQPVQQDKNRRWRSEQIQGLKANHVRFKKGLRHRWGVSLIQYEYEDDANEEMLWVRTTPTLRKFYFFKDNELWKIFYAYSTNTWPGKTYEQVVEEKFKKWFGVSPANNVKQDEKTKAPILRWLEWTAMGGEKIRSFNMTQVYGVLVLVVVDGRAEGQIGQRLPNMPKEEKFSDEVTDVLGNSDVCYDKSGDIVECGTGGKVNID